MSILRLKDENGNWQDVPAIIGPQGEPGKDGVTGADGKSAYQSWLDAGNTGTEADFLASLVGPQGPEGKPGEDGKTPDLSDVVKFVNGAGPDENGNVEIEVSDFKVYRNLEGITISSTGSTVGFDLDSDAFALCEELVNDYIKGARKQLLIFDASPGDENNGGAACMVFIPYESRSNLDDTNSGSLYFQSLTPSTRWETLNSGNYTLVKQTYYMLQCILDEGKLTTAKLTNSSTVYSRSVIMLNNLQTGKYTFDGLHTYNKLPQSSVEPTNDKDLVNKAYADSLGSYGIKVIDNKYRNNIAGYSENGYLNLDMLYTNNPNSEVYVVGESTLTFRPNEMYGNRSLKAGSLIVVYNSKYGIIFDFSSKFNYFIVNGSVKGKSLDDTYFDNLKELNFLPKDNSKTYTPTSAYHPATKQYVDNLVGDIESLLSEV